MIRKVLVVCLAWCAAMLCAAWPLSYFGTIHISHSVGQPRQRLGVSVDAGKAWVSHVRRARPDDEPATSVTSTEWATLGFTREVRVVPRRSGAFTERRLRAHAPVWAAIIVLAAYPLIRLVPAIRRRRRERREQDGKCSARGPDPAGHGPATSPGARYGSRPRMMREVALSALSLAAVATCALWPLSYFGVGNASYFFGQARQSFQARCGQGHATLAHVRRANANDAAPNPVNSLPWPTFGFTNEVLEVHYTDTKIDERHLRAHMPIGAVLMLFAAYPLIEFVFGAGRRRRARRLLDGQCLDCGYDLTGNESGKCPECGTRVSDP